MLVLFCFFQEGLEHFAQNKLTWNAFLSRGGLFCFIFLRRDCLIFHPFFPLQFSLFPSFVPFL